MTPSEKVLSLALKKTTADIWSTDERDQLTVKFVRTKVESQHDLDEGFFRTPTWKDKSKHIIEDEAARLRELEDRSDNAPASQPSPAKPEVKVVPLKEKSAIVKQGTKRSSNGASTSQPKKRQKKAASPLSEDEDEESELTTAEDTPLDSDDSDASAERPPKKIKNAAAPKAVPKKKSKAEPDLSEDDVEKPKPKSKPTPTKSKSVPKPKKSEPINGSDDPESSIVDEGDESELSDLSELSDVLDQVPKPKRSRSAKGTRKASSKPAKTAKPKVVANLMPDEAELKTLQGQLKKCGVNKIWGFELKQFEDDSKAKIRHLRKMLKEVGMDGRFSEARAKEIKERRELMEDVEAIQAEAGIVGKEKTRRAKVKAGQSMKLPEDSEEEEGEEDPHAARVARAQADLAFLGSEESSDDD